MRRASLLLSSIAALASSSSAGCGEDETQLFNAFDPAATVEEVPCAGAEETSPWKPRDLPTTKGLADIWGTSASDLWIAAGESTVLHYDGVAWSDRSPAVGVDLHAIAGTATDDVWAIGRAGIAVHWDGAAWTQVESNTTNDLSNIWPFARNDVWFVGEDGVRRWNGTAIVQDPAWPKEQVNAIWGESPSEMRLVGNTAIHHYDGERFHTQPIEKSGKLAAVWGTDAQHVYAIGHNAMNRPGFAELVGGQWLFSGAPPRAFYFSLWTLEPDELWAGANDTTIFYYASGSWCREHLGGIGAINAFFGFSHDDIWAVGAVRDPQTNASRPIFLERGGP